MFKSFADPMTTGALLRRDDASFTNASAARVLDDRYGFQPKETPPAETVASSRIKRALDILGASLLLPFLLPLLALVAIAIKFDSSGPVFFRQTRSGMHGRTFKIMKFRTMRVMEDSDVHQATLGDSRVTRVGAVLRRTSIDELPQLFNVLVGEMSLIGPRPHALAHDREFSRIDPAYNRRFRAKPGVTGLAQVSGLRGEIKNAEGVIARVRADNEYVDTWTPILDMKILARTALLLVRGDEHAY